MMDPMFSDELMANLQKHGMPKLSDDDHKEIRGKTKESLQKNFPDMTDPEIGELQVQCMMPAPP